MSADKKNIKNWQRAIAGLGIAIGVLLFLLPTPDSWPPRALPALGLVAIAVGFWATETIPVHLTSFIFFFLALVLAIAPAPVVFSGFHSGAVWLVFAGVVIGIAMQQTGLGTQIAEAIITRFGRSYGGLVVGIGLTGFATAFFMPSAMGRIVIMTPIIAAIADRLGYGSESKGRAGLILAFCFCTVVPAMGLLPATVPNVVFAGAVESIHGITVRYTDFMALHLTVAGSLSLVVLLLLSWLLFREPLPDGAKPVDETGPMALTGEQKRLAFILAITLGFWVTDKIHGVAPAWVGLGAAIACLLPIMRMVPAKALVDKANYGPWFFVAGIIGLGAVVAETGLGKVLGGLLIEVVGFAPGADAFSFGALMLLGGLIMLGLNVAGVPAVLTPLATDIMQATGWPLETVLMSQINSFFMVFIPFQVAPILTGMMIGGVAMRFGLRMCVTYSMIYLFVIAPINFLWWRSLGMFGS
ncbi:MAG: sodium:sulfate symporter [Rhodospirillaceae bacterium]|nr:sodium:sulfate symporter [Rhodospirillaceae bacterium]HAA91232.1 sodium:sulfate symporter [Rhodospirillaceae bacterium]